MSEHVNHELILVSGPSKSGKSLWAEKLISKKPLVTYIATHKADYDNDQLWRERIKIHRNRRPKHWKTIDVYEDLSKLIIQVDIKYSILIDSLGGFVFTHIKENNSEWLSKKNKLLSTLKKSNRLIVIVTEEVSWGITPTSSIGNIFRDRLGELTQDINYIATTSWLVVAGNAINLNSISTKV